MASDQQRLHGKANGNGPMHILANRDVQVALCGVTRCGYMTRPSDSGRVCRRCIIAERSYQQPPVRRPDGPDTLTPALLDAAREAAAANAKVTAILDANAGTYAWMVRFPDEREELVKGLRAAGVTLDRVGRLFGLTRERVRQIEAGAP